jgi:peptide alpha-N-acetyltransferase
MENIHRAVTALSSTLFINPFLQVIDLIGNELSEPYSIFTYRYFLRQWPYLCYLATDPTTQRCFGCVVSKMDVHRGKMLRGYIGMLTVEKEYRHLGVGKGA